MLQSVNPQIYTIRIAHVKMKVKFQCRMCVEYNKQVITQEVAMGPNQNIAVLNQKVDLLKGQDQNSLKLYVNLLTNKRAKYIAAHVEIHCQELARVQSTHNQKLVIPLSKCLDSQAYIQVYVLYICDAELPVFREHSKSASKSLASWGLNHAQVGHHSSLANALVLSPKYAADAIRDSSQTKSRVSHDYTRVKRISTVGSIREHPHVVTHSRNLSNVNDLRADMGDQQYFTQVQSRKRLKSRERQEKQSIQVSQAASKLQILKHWLRCQELQKQGTQKQVKIKQLQRKVNEYKSQIASLQKTKTGMNQQISTLQSEVCMADKQLNELKKHVQISSRSCTDTDKSCKSELEDFRKLYRTLQEQMNVKLHERQVMMLTNSNLNQQVEQYRRKSSLKQEVEEKLFYLQEQVAQKDKSLQAIKQNNEQLHQQIKELNIRIAAAEDQRNNIMDNENAWKSKCMVIESNLLILQKNHKKMEDEFLICKQRYNESQLIIKKLQNEKLSMERSYESSLASSRALINKFEGKLQEQKSNSMKAISDLQTANNKLKLQIRELENKISFTLQNELEAEKRTSQRLMKENQQIQEKERKTKKQLRSMEQKYTSVSNQLEMCKSKVSSLEQNSKMQAERNMSTITHLKKQLEEEASKSLQSRERGQQLLQDNSSLLIKLKEDKSQLSLENRDLTLKLADRMKEAQRYRQLYRQEQQKCKDILTKEKQLANQLQISSCNENEHFRQYQSEINASRQSIALAEQRYIEKCQQSDKLANENGQLSAKLADLQKSNQQTCQELNLIKGQRDRQNSEIEILKHRLQNLSSRTQDKQKTFLKMRNSLEAENLQKSQAKQELSRLELNYHKAMNDHNRFKEHVYDTITREFVSLSCLDHMGFMEKEQMSLRSFPTNDSQAKINLSAEPPTANEIINIIKLSVNQMKLAWKKISDEYQTVDEELLETREKLSQTQERLTDEIRVLQNCMQELQRQVNFCKSEKEAGDKYARYEIKGLEQSLADKCSELQSVHTRVEELVFKISGMQMEKEADKEYYEQCRRQNKHRIAKLQQIYEEQKQILEQLENEKAQLETDYRVCETDLQNLKEDCRKKQDRVRNLDYEVKLSSSLIDELKSKSQLHLSKIAELELMLSSMKQSNLHNQQMLSEQQKKSVKTKQFINNVIQQKEAAIRQEIMQAQQIIELQTLLEACQSKALSLEQEHARMGEEISSQKDKNHKLMSANKKYQNELKALQENCAKIQQSNKQLERSCTKLLEDSSQKEQKYRSELKAMAKEHKDKKEELQLAAKLHEQEISLQRKQIIRFQEQTVPDLKEECRRKNNQIETQSQQLQNNQRIIDDKNVEINGCKDLKRRMETHRLQLQASLQSLEAELREKDKLVYQLSGRVSSMEQDFQEKLMESIRGNEFNEENMNFRYEAMCEDYEVKIEDLEKEADYLRKKLEVSEQELYKLTESLRQAELEDSKYRALNHEKLIKVQEGKNMIISELKNEIKKLQKSYNEIQHQKGRIQVDKENLQIKLANTESLNKKLEETSSEQFNRIRNIQGQIVGLQEKEAAKELRLKKCQSEFTNFQWSLEREIKKEFQMIAQIIIGSMEEFKSAEKKTAVQHVQKIQSKLIVMLNEKKQIM